MFTIRIEIAKSWSDKRYNAVILPHGDALRHSLPTPPKATIGLYIGPDRRIRCAMAVKANKLITDLRKEGQVFISLGKGLKRMSPHYPISDFMADSDAPLLHPVRARNDNRKEVIGLVGL